MADPWTEWYSGKMAPPMRTPEGLVPAPNTVPKMTVDEMYEGIYGPASSGLTTRQVQTVAVDPFTGQPIVAGQTGNMPATSNAMSYPGTREVVTPGFTREGQGFEGGASYGPSYRLLPDNPAAAATERVATGLPDMRGMPFNTGSRDMVAQRQAGAGFKPSPKPPADDFLQPAVDPWADMLTPGGRPVRPTAQPLAAPQRVNPQVAAALAQRQVITEPGGGGAFVNRNPAPNTPLSHFDENILLPASMNNSRWRTGY